MSEHNNFKPENEQEPPCAGKTGRETLEYINAQSSNVILQRLEDYEPFNVYRIHSIKSRTKQ